MKTSKIFSFAVLALTVAACTSDEITQSQPSASTEMIPFSAVIKNEAATRGLEAAADGKSITATWEKGEQVAVVHGKNVDVLSVTSVDANTGAATVSGAICAPADGETVQVVYLGKSSTVMADFKTTLEALGTVITTADITTQASKPMATDQDGSLEFINQQLDYRYAEAKLNVSDNKATFQTAPSLLPQFSIWKVHLVRPHTPNLVVSKLVVKKDDAVCATIDLGTSTKSDFYVAVTPGEGSYRILAANDHYNYISEETITATLEAGKFYTSPEMYMYYDDSSATYRDYSYLYNGVTQEWKPKVLPIPTDATIVTSDTKSINNYCVVSGDVAIDGDVSFGGYTYLILLDGAHLTINGSLLGENKALSIYTQAENTGKLDVNCSGRYGIQAKHLSIHGGQINVTQINTNNSGSGIDTEYFDVFGKCSVNVESKYDGVLISGNGDLLCYGGNLKVTSDDGNAIQLFTNSKFEMTGGRVELESKKNVCFYVSGNSNNTSADIKIKGGSLIAKSGGDDAITITNRNLIISGDAEVTAYGGRVPTNTTYRPTIGNGISLFNQESAPITEKDLTVKDNGKVTAIGGDAKEGAVISEDKGNTYIPGGCGVWGNVNVEGGSVTATGGANDYGNQLGIFGNITLGDGIGLYAGDSEIDVDTYGEPSTTGPTQTPLETPNKRYVVIK